MSDEVQRHYDNLLAAHYSWMNALSFAEKAAEQRELLAELGIEPKGFAIDLGCGPGYQAYALSELGAQKVLAIDTSSTLLDELNEMKGDRPIQTELADLRLFTKFVEPASADTITCMGDTLTHLGNRHDVSCLFHDAHDRLSSGGRFVLTFRDLSTEPTGLERFVPVRADDERIMICALDYYDENVVVNDLIHVRTEDGWTLLKSSYRKLRLKPSDVTAELNAVGFTVEHDRPCGRLHAIVGRKP